MGTNHGRYKVDLHHFADGPEAPTNRSEDFDENMPLRDTTAQRALLDRAVLRVGNPAELARQLRVTDSHISRLRKGSAGVSIVIALRLADVLDEDGVAPLRTSVTPRRRKASIGSGSDHQSGRARPWRTRSIDSPAAIVGCSRV